MRLRLTGTRWFKDSRPSSPSGLTRSRCLTTLSHSPTRPCPRLRPPPLPTSTLPRQALLTLRRRCRRPFIRCLRTQSCAATLPRIRTRRPHRSIQPSPTRLSPTSMQHWQASHALRVRGLHTTPSLHTRRSSWRVRSPRARSGRRSTSPRMTGSCRSRKRYSTESRRSRTTCAPASWQPPMRWRCAST
ncbi:hypothetical protein DMC30DRAFT_405270 [Rhodotorula diobovata]|uniref:Uncharacterized protein n=1 Tax=Rhodotorula diobovata TaxID=5288 RepID=A0A5C5FMZ5_9BASI|nr:hypothetical protein DMC30DRAFT_405270 [Rhodotorula diobovata]